MLKAEGDNRKATHNSSHFKKLDQDHADPVSPDTSCSADPVSVDINWSAELVSVDTNSSADPDQLTQTQVQTQF